jgi:hypothetical protein
VPTANCGTLFSGGDAEASSATWVGIDGDQSVGDNTGPEQIGTDSNCGGTFAPPYTGEYHAWWEMAPNEPQWVGGPQSTGSYPVYPGDRITASVTSTGVPGQYKLTIDDESQNWPGPYSTTQTNTAATGMTAECIEEQPAALGFPLTNFGSVTFSHCMTKDSNTIDTPIWDHPNNAITMTDSTGTVTKASVSTPLADDGTEFTVTWHHG